MRIVYYIVGAVMLAFGVGLVVATVMSKITPLTGYSAGGCVILGGVAHFVAGAKRYRGHWAFVTGVALATLAFASLGTGIDDWSSGRDREDIPFAVFLIINFLAFSAVTLWSAHKLHRCTLELESLRQKTGS